MKTYLILISLIAVCQTKILAQSNNCEKVYILIKENDDVLINKSGSDFTLEISYGIKDNREVNEPTTNESVIIVQPEPYDRTFTFKSIGNPTQIPTIDGLNIFSIDDIKSNNKSVWKKYPYIMNFIEKSNDRTYLIYQMRLKMKE